MSKAIITAFIILGLTACASNYKRQPNQEVVLKDARGRIIPPPAAPTSHDGKALTPITPNDKELAEGQAKAEEIKEAVAAAAEHIHETHTTTEQGPETKTETQTEAVPPAPAHAHSHTREAGPISADKSLGWLKNGNTRFTKGTFRADGASSKDRARLVGGQKPHAIVLSCSDSRVPPEVVFDQKLGEIFVVRTAGQDVGTNVIASIEYALSHLGANLLVVMGHESCGALKATLSALQGADLGSPALNAMAEELKPHLQSYADKKPSDHLLDESWSNVTGVAKELTERSALIRDAVASGEVKIVKAMYHLESGNVEWR